MENFVLEVFPRFYSRSVFSTVQDQVQHNGGQTANRDAAVADELDAAWELAVERWYTDRYQGDCNADGDDHHIAVALEFDTGQGLDSAGSDHAKHC